ncbi:hypothetical protein ACFSX9_12245 [Flavobacterium ardleyense]|uniref:Lipocalin-like domain-containing protein n=1 Tax=Flavobacterium ardleyense TaxID=2038737 RepID=A0ABW5ZBP3_9FLAO
MKKIIILTIFLLANVLTAQENSELMGRWKVNSVFDNDFYYKVENDSIVLSEKMKRRHKSAVGLQNYKATIRLENRGNIFEFKDKNQFHYSLSDKAIYPTFKGTFEVINNLILLDVVNLANIRVHKEASFYFKDKKLYLTMHLEVNSPTTYILERI